MKKRSANMLPAVAALTPAKQSAGKRHPAALEVRGMMASYDALARIIADIAIANNVQIVYEPTQPHPGSEIHPLLVRDAA